MHACIIKLEGKVCTYALIVSIDTVLLVSMDACDLEALRHLYSTLIIMLGMLKASKSH